MKFFNAVEARADGTSQDVAGTGTGAARRAEHLQLPSPPTGIPADAVGVHVLAPWIGADH
ncbi:hypothetical protein [Streptomyces sp. NPDC088254]|uniref:hypothetical protein n=1 Tax=Streptomyces sp. NPDC088254 TaxID=3365847 RepID=UPI00380BA467